MGRKCVTVKTLHGFTIDELQKKYENTSNNYEHSVYQAIILSCKGFDTTAIIKILNKSRPTVVSYINSWNEDPVSCVIDNHGGNIPSQLTDEIIEDIKEEYISLQRLILSFKANLKKWQNFWI